MRTSIMIVSLILAVGMAAATEWNVLDFGAIADGEMDCTSAFQQALDRAGTAGGGTVNVPAGHYRIAGTLRIPGSVLLQGTYRIPQTTNCPGRVKFDGSVLLVYAGRGSQEGEPFIRLASNMAALAGFMIFYPEWKQTDVPPVPYPPTVLAENNENTAVLDCLIVNPYEALHFQSAHRMLVRNVFGYPSFRGLYIDNCCDIGRVENCHFWPFNTAYSPEDPYSKWVNINGVAFEFARTDWQYCINTFCFGYGVGYKFSTSQYGSCNGNFVGIGADSCQRAVLVDTLPGTIDLLITNGEFVGRWGSQDSIGVDIVGKTTQRVSLNNCAFWGPLDRCIWLRAPEAQLTATACGFDAWDVGAIGSAAIQADSGKLIVQGCNFQREGTHALIGEAVQSAILMGNQAGIGLRVDNQAGARTQLVANETDSMTWTDEARRNYRIDVGTPGDSRYVSLCHGREDAAEWPEGGTKRWFSPNTRLDLPVITDVPYTMTINLRIPANAVGEANGIYLGETCLASLPAEETTADITVPIPPQSGSLVTLTVRSKGWIPAQVVEGSNDHRELAVAAAAIAMKAEAAPEKTFDANTGKWIE
jgi:hypothetical protein